MKTLFYPKLAWNGIQKNRKLYVPYILSCIGTVMMSYILQSLSYSPLLHEMKGGSTIEMVLSLGKFVIAVFALIFLLYTNSFLSRRRLKEFGLYSILGMDRHSISWIVLWESLIVSAIGMAGGISLGILFSKLAELGLLNVIHSDINYRFTIAGEAITFTLEIFGTIFLLLLLKSLIQVRKSRPLELLHSETVGEKPPKANLLFAILGVLLLGSAYCIAVSIKTPLTALILFFVAVIMVIIATYLLFISGSVALCKILQRNKRYYYKKQHFISVSSMSYRMKRNGAGLASICILATMVLVMISSTSSLYFGANDAIRSRYPQNTGITVELNSIEHFKDDETEKIRNAYQTVFHQHNFTPQNIHEYRYASIAGSLTGSNCNPNSDLDNFKLNYDDIRMLYFISVSDYNEIMHTNYSLSEKEALLFPMHCEYDQTSITLGEMRLSIVGTLDDFIDIGEANSTVIPSLMLVIPDYETLRPLETITDKQGNQLLSHQYYYGYDYGAGISDTEAIRICTDQANALRNLDFLHSENGLKYSYGCVASEMSNFFSIFGGLFFLGIMLSIVFIFAAAVIIYYKQISEGYEDQARFDIMQKVGMTKQDIKKSINSQVLTVFFAPLLFSGMHLVFAFPVVWKLLQLFDLHNLTLVIWITAGAFCAFSLFYGIIYKVTAKAYFSIVATENE